MPSSLLCHVINQNSNKWISSATFANIQLCDIIEFWFGFKFILSCLPKLIEKLFSLFSFSKFGYWVLASVKILFFFFFFRYSTSTQFLSKIVQHTDWLFTLLYENECGIISYGRHEFLFLHIAFSLHIFSNFCWFF